MLAFERICEIAAEHDTEKIAGQVSFARAIEAEVLRITGDGRGEAVARLRRTEFGSSNNRKSAMHFDTLVPIDVLNKFPDGTILYATPPQQEHAAPVQDGWMPIETAPKDGTEFIAAYARQGFVKELVRWNTVHKFWISKGEWLPGFEANATHWIPIPEDPKVG